jgi:hypothetical protein
MLRQKSSTAWHFGQSGTLCAAVVEGSTRITANGVRRASFIRCFQVTYSGWAEILLKAELSKPHCRLDSSLTKINRRQRDGPLPLRSEIGKAVGCPTDRPQSYPHKYSEELCGKCYASTDSGDSLRFLSQSPIAQFSTGLQG